MQNEHQIENIETLTALNASREISPATQRFEECGRNRKLRLRMRPRRRPSCMTRRAMVAALREAELAVWKATGGDFLNSMHQAVGTR